MCRNTRVKLAHGICYFLLLTSSFVYAEDGALNPAVLKKIKHDALLSLAQLEPEWINSGGLELITGGPSRERTESRWGHVSLRFVGSGRTPLEDVVVQALGLPSAEDNPLEFAYHGVFGKYPLFLLFVNTGELIQSYYFSEARGYTRTILPSTSELRQKLIDQLKEVSGADAPPPHYYFFGNNCMSAMANLLAKVGFTQLELPVPFLPTQGSLHLKRSFLSPWPEVVGVDVPDFEHLQELGDRGDLSKASTLNLQRLLVFMTPKLGARRIDVLSELSSRSDLKKAGEVYGVQRLPNSFYQRDQLPSAEDIRHTFTADQLGRATLFDRAAWNTTYTTSFCEQPGVAPQCRYFGRIRTLLEPLASN